MAALRKCSDGYWFAYIGVNILEYSPELLSFSLSALLDCLFSVP
jgi:hypothetical protein